MRVNREEKRSRDEQSNKQARTERKAYKHQAVSKWQQKIINQTHWMCIVFVNIY